ncbi:MAG TPA: hypothetical protein VKA32_05755, partial [Gammaproteobacteria bacterium]|nr:hypothetical protein [Gammaproteobacteria bacterium]
MQRSLDVLRLAILAMCLAGNALVVRAADVDPNELVVWIGSDSGPDALRSAGDRFTEATGIPVS